MREPLPKLLIVDDDRQTCALVKQYFERHDYQVATAQDGGEMAAQMARQKFDLVILDVMLPGKNGFELCRDIRGRSDVPVIMLTAVNDLTDRVVGLEIGADDYVPKPFEPRELLARVRAVIRRKMGGGTAENAELPQGYGFEGFTLDLATRKLTADGGVVVSLTAAEFDLLAAFARNPRRSLTRDQLLELTTGRAVNAFDRSIDILVSRLRKKLERNAGPEELIKTMRGTGYFFTPSVRKL
ncbi:MAG: response regulator transcription factor [Rhizobiales bacterium]|nr:response regulator transcription factor [Hyphomicrobiales bacterium]MBI3674587.1 response regulator transcription factor [Hyphomicrobiales bacterium]